MRTDRRNGGFTLVELMVVVAIIAIGITLAARVFSRGVRGETGPAMARSVLIAMQDARHTAIALGRTTRVVLDGPNEQILTSSYDPTLTTPGWGTATTVTLPRQARLCTASSSVVLGPVTPACPLATTQSICFWPNGRVGVVSGSTGSECALTSPSVGTGATIYLDTNSGNEAKYRIVVWGLTGMAKIIDTW